MKMTLKRQRQLALLATGAAAFAYTGGACFRFPDEVKFLQGIGDASIATLTAPIGKEVGTDFNTIINKPATVFLQSMWDNLVSRQFPRGLDGTKIVLE